MLLSGLDLKPFILVHTSSMVAVYTVGMIAAVRLMARGSLGWWMAASAAVLCTGMLVLAIGSLLPAAALAVAAVAVSIVRRTRAARWTTDAVIPVEPETKASAPSS